VTKVGKMSANISALISPKAEINLSYLGSCRVWDPEYLIDLCVAVSVGAS